MSHSSYKISFPAVVTFPKPIYSFPDMLNKTSLFRMVLLQEFDNTTRASVLLPGLPVKLYALHNGNAAQVSTLVVSQHGSTFKTEAFRSTRNHDLPCDPRMDRVFIRAGGLWTQSDIWPISTRSTRTMNLRLRWVKCSQVGFIPVRVKQFSPFQLPLGWDRLIMGQVQFPTWDQLRSISCHVSRFRMSRHSSRS